ncbi:MAG TPA: lipid-A-disaccharide synthase [Usitatibacter sp.]|jgi:lipid-A-disaccharide synthase|nr:lipid-A-disaccharide synthase [Usitatibacter sp.]
MRIAIVAGEASGDLLGAALIRAVKERFPDARFEGIAGPKMMAEGAVSHVPMEKLAVRGIVEVLKHVREILAIRRTLTRRLLEERPDLFIGIDAPDFCLPLEARLKAAGIPTIHYVSPSVWAWRPERLQKIAHAVSRMLVLFPFEQPIYERAGIPVSFVGHPLADAMPIDPDRDGARTQLRLARAGTTVALLPGSRLGELELHADLMIETARAMHARRPDTRFFVPLATRETRDYFERRIYALEARELPITILFGHASLALTSADVALVASGTATLEAALARCPMVVTYKLRPLTYRLVKRRALLPYFSLPNILSGEFIVPEILQDDATPQTLAQALGNWLDHKEARVAVRGRFARIHRSLAVGHEGRVIEALMPYLGGHAPSADPRASIPVPAPLRG